MPYAISDGIRIRYVADGAGPPLVLHAGFVGSVEDWIDAGYVAALHDRYRVVMLDPRGQGRSDTPHEPAAYSVEHRIADVLSVLDAEGIERAHFWGYSMGGGLGLALGLRASHRLHALVVGAGNPFSVADNTNGPDWMLEHLRGGMETLVRAMEWSGTDAWLSPGERARWLGADIDALIAARIQRLRAPYIEERDAGAIVVPTLLYAGTADSVAATLGRLAGLMPHATYIDLDELDHAQTLARSELVLPHVMAFLGRVERAAGLRS